MSSAAPSPPTPPSGPDAIVHRARSTAPSAVPRRTWGQRLVIATNLALIVVSLGLAVLLDYGYGRAAAINRIALDRSLTAVPGAEPGERVLNILLVGSDSSATLDEDDPIQIGRRGERFGDVIIIAHLDERSGDIALLSLPRDLWVTLAGTDRQARINKAFELGGPSLLIETIEDQFDIPIHHYVNVDFAGFQGLVAAVGSVDVYFETPARDWNVNASPVPRTQTGFLMSDTGCQALDPEQALAYVRSRYYQTQNADGEWVTDPTADLGRIRRQQDFLRQLIQQAIAMGARNPFVLRDLVDIGLEHVAIDQRLTPQLILDVGTTYRSFDPDQLQTYSFPAADSRVGERQVLLPMADEAEPLIELFRGAPFADPSTVGITVVTAGDVHRILEVPSGVGAWPSDTAPPPARFDPAAALRARGFEVDESTGTVPADGLVVRHGPDGRHAAEVVVAALRSEVDRGEAAGDVTTGADPGAALDVAADAATAGDPAADAVGGPNVTVEQVSRLQGRSIEVVVGQDADDPSASGGPSAGTDAAAAGAGDPDGPPTRPDTPPTVAATGSIDPGPAAHSCTS